MSAKAAIASASVVAALLAHADAQAQVEPTMQVCRELGALDAVWQNFDQQDVNAPRPDVDAAARDVSAELDRIADIARPMSPAAFDQLKLAHAQFEAALQAVPDEATPEQVQDQIAIAKDNDRFAYQNFASNIVCPPTRPPY